VIVIDPKGETGTSPIAGGRKWARSPAARSVWRGEQAHGRAQPFDLFDRPGALIDADAEMLAGSSPVTLAFTRTVLGQLGPLADERRDRRDRADQPRPTAISARFVKS